MNLPAVIRETPEAVYDRLMATRRGGPVEDTLARILASWHFGLGAMPQWLGMGEDSFAAMMAHHFPGVDAHSLTTAKERIDPQRADELEDLRKLLLENRSGRSDSELWIVEIVIAGCMGNDHLWQDLGLWQRADLSKLMMDNFEPLARRNDKDMKWKKFLYKQLCEAEGIYVCRSPSCEVCVDYDNCFGSEE
ncbi:MAG: nitrogen fixation protein NifQ [Chromatiales bacterium]|jgi:nitrogen fixation protein NifQ